MIGKGSRSVARDDAGAWDPSSGQCLFDWSAPNERELAQLPHLDAPRNETDRGGESPPIELLDPAALLELGLVLHERGDAAGAASLYERATVVGAVAYFNLGVAREDLGDPVGALQAYRAAVDLDPRCADAHYNAARLCELAGDQVGALRHLRAYSTCPSR